jgi:mRNA-degrading endonuclease RelE of RelBE toxin-antitoxin system
MNKFKIIWSSESIQDLKKIKNNISKTKLKDISIAPKQIVFGEQYQVDEYRNDCRRILIGETFSLVPFFYYIDSNRKKLLLSRFAQLMIS